MKHRYDILRDGNPVGIAYGNSPEEALELYHASFDGDPSRRWVPGKYEARLSQKSVDKTVLTR